MSHAYIFRKFSEGTQVSIDWNQLSSLLVMHGFHFSALAEGPNDVHCAKPSNEVGDVCIFCTEGVVTEVFIDRPLYQNSFRDFAFHLLTELEVVMFSDNGLVIRASGSTQNELPQGFAENFEDADLCVTSTLQMP